MGQEAVHESQALGKSPQSTSGTPEIHIDRHFKLGKD